MLQFPKGYFEDEDRDGFHIESTMKCAWAAQLEVLKKVEDICKKHGLQYFAFFGTLLGAVRHGGYIPWDDDIDIAMKRKDYLKFLEVARTELPREYKFLTIYDETEWYEINARITNSDYIDISEQRLREYHGCPFAVGIDIYPMDYMPDDPRKLDMQVSVLKLISQIDSFIAEKEEHEIRGQKFNTYDAGISEGLKSLEKLFNIELMYDNTIRNQLFRLYDRVCMMYGTEDDRYMTTYPAYMVSSGKIKVMKHWVEDVVELPFETTTIWAPRGYELSLCVRFGRKYMTPLQIAASHDYPFYKEQLSLLKERKLWDDTEKLAKLINAENDTVAGDDHNSKNENIPDEWKYFIVGENGSKKKVILYRVSSVEFYLNPYKIMDKMKNSLKVFKENKDRVVVLWRDDLMTIPTLEITNPDAAKEYREIVDNFKEGNWGIYDISDDENTAISFSNAYYGDYSSIIPKLIHNQKPIMIQNSEILD